MLDERTAPDASWTDLGRRLIDLQSLFIDTAESLAPEKRELGGVCGHWSPRELVAHISGWDAEVLRQFQLFKTGLTGEIEHDVDTFNERSVAHRAGWSWRATLAELQQIHEAYPAALDLIDESDRANNPQYTEWLQVLISHYEHHAAQLQKWA